MVVHPCIFICINSSGSTLFVPFRGRGFPLLCLLPSLSLRTRTTRTLTPICSKQFVRFVETNWAMLALMKVHHIRGTATPDEQALGSFTRHKFEQLTIWDLWLASEWKQLDALQKQNLSGIPCPAPPGATVLRSHWNCIIKPRGTRKARMYCDGSKCAAPELRFAPSIPRASTSHTCVCSFLCLLP
jgi:hypothetical protein